MSAWDHVAAGYRVQHGLERAALDRAVALARPHLDGARVLDAGSGDGALLAALERSGPGPGDVTALDASRAMLNASPSGSGATRVEGRIEAMPFPDAAFDVAFVAYVLHLLDPAQYHGALAELHRVLVPGGHVATVTPHAGATAVGGAWRRIARAADGTALRALGGLRPLDPVDDLRRAGFRPCRGATVTAGYPSLCVLARKP